MRHEKFYILLLAKDKKNYSACANKILKKNIIHCFFLCLPLNNTTTTVNNLLYARISKKLKYAPYRNIIGKK